MRSGKRLAAIVMISGWIITGGPVTWAREGTGGREGDLLAWGAGARALALGKAYVALATDATAAYWNPAGLAFAEQSQVGALHAALWEGTQYDFLGVAIPTLDLGTFGWFGSLLSTNGLERRDDENNVVAGGFAATKVGTGLAYGWELQSGWGVGFTVKWLGRWLDQDPSGYLTLDVGSRFQWAEWGALGVVIQHGAAVRYGDTSDALPLVVRAGLVLNPLPELGQLVADLELATGEGASSRWRVGMESAPLGPLVARVGVDSWELAGGVGVNIQDLLLDYAGAWHPLLGFSHRFSVSTKWGETRSALRVVHARSAFDRAVAALAVADRKGPDTVGGAEAMEEARRALEEALEYDHGNTAASILLQRFTAPVKP